MDFDTRVKLAIYDTFASTERAPTAHDIASALETTPDAVREAFGRLCSQRLLVLQPDKLRIRMAPPFSAVPTPFSVRAPGRSFYANCVWDAYGIAAALHQDIDVSTACGCCAAPMTLAVRQGSPSKSPGVAHFAVPAAHWWDDIVYT